MSRGVALTETVDTAYDGDEKGKRLNLILSSGTFVDLAALARERRTTMTEIVRLALGLVKVAVREAELGHKLVVATEDGQVIKELVLPG
jgi:hypothetical protein